MNESRAPRVLIFAGSARKASLNKKLARAAVRAVGAAGGEATFVDLDDYPMPVYHGDLEAAEGMPAKARELRALFLDHDALAIASPENNGSVSALLKNVLDWISRSVGDGKGESSGLAPYRGKVALLMGATPGPWGTIRGLTHLRQILSGLGVLVLGAQVPVARAGAAFDDSGALVEASAVRALDEAARALVEAARRMGSNQ